jgi:hypothetical protein
MVLSVGLAETSLISIRHRCGMPLRQQRAASFLGTDPQALLGRLLLQLKLKLAGLGADASARGQRECLRAAQEVESAVAQLEACTPLLSATMSMVRAAGNVLAHVNLPQTHAA